MPQAAATAAPPLEPPGVLVSSQGLRVMPVSGELVTPFQPNSGVVVLPSRTAPSSRSLATVGASSSQFCFGSTALEPRSVGQPLVMSRSLTVAGTPSTRPMGWPFIQRASDALAEASADASSTRQRALKRGLRRVMRASAALVTSTGESFFARYWANSSTAGRRAGSWLKGCSQIAREAGIAPAEGDSFHNRRCIVEPVAARLEWSPSRGFHDRNVHRAAAPSQPAGP